MSGHVYRRCPKPIVKACEAGRCTHRWAFTFSYGSDPETKRRRQYTGGGYRLKSEAEDALTEAKAKAKDGGLVTRTEERARAEAALRENERQQAAAAIESAAALTCAQWWEKWLDLGVGPRGTRWKPNTADSYRAIVDTHLTEQLGDVVLRDLTSHHLQARLDQLGAPDPVTGEQRTKETCARVRAVLTASMKTARRRGLVDLDPSADLILTGADSKVRMHVWNPEEAARFLAIADRHDLGAMYRLLLATGMRRGELCGLRDEDLELDAKPPRLTVRHTITQRGGTLRQGTPKTKAGARVVHLGATTVEVLRRHRRRQAALELASPAWADLRRLCGLVEGYSAEGGNLVFTRDDGTPVNPDTISKTWTRLCVEAGVPVLRLHDGRHTHATLALAAGVADKVLADRLGHSSVSVTRDIYMHTLPDVDHKAAEATEAYLPPIADGAL